MADGGVLETLASSDDVVFDHLCSDGTSPSMSDAHGSFEASQDNSREPGASSLDPAITSSTFRLETR